jgi:hypothetical protein
VAGARKVGEQVDEIRSRLGKEATSMSKGAAKRFDAWAVEGEKLIKRLTDAKVVDDLASRVDFDQVSTQVNKLRDQLEDLLATWRNSFRPEKLPTVKIEASTDGVKFDTIPAKKTNARKPAARKTTAAKKSAAAKKTTAKKTPTAKKTTARKTVAKKAS